MRENLGCILEILGGLIICAIIIAISTGIAYWISASNMPEWFKFWLLK